MKHPIRKHSQIACLIRVVSQHLEVKSWADSFGEDLYYIVTKYSGSLLLQKKYKDVEPNLKIKEVDGLELVKLFSKEMARMLYRKVEAVERLVEAAEDADVYHEYNSSLQFDYYNAVLINEKDEKGNYVSLGNEFILEPNEHFNNLPVNTTSSNIQLPTNVYNKDPDIVNGIYMSEALDAVFVENFERDPTLTWQYFGSTTGFFRLYPGIKWIPDENGVLSFDCRNRGWYIQAATSPKDIVIVVDISGSMKGLRLTIAKHTVVTILDTLGENDFVNIIAYNDYVHYIESCFKGILVQADRDNREQSVGKVNKALTESFKILREFRNAGQGGLCNQAIMLLTDGAMEDYEYVFEKFNWPDRKVRVFTYLIGREVSFAQNVKWIACNNKGYYTQISTLADVQENVMEYLHVLSRPMVINHDHDIIWTEAYMDSAVTQSLLLMTTVAMPVFSKKNETRSHGILLGVIGSDVPLRELLKLAPRYKLGIHGYAFLITNNGYILSHPDLRPLYKEGKKLKPKPNYNSVDLSEVEWEDVNETLRTAMINGETGYVSMDVKVPMDKGKRILFLTNDYFFTHISGTPFSLGIVLSRGYGEYVLLGDTSVEEGLHDLLQPDLTLANEWIYCVTDIDPAHRKLSQLEAVIRFITAEEPDLECDEELVQQVLFDAVVTAPMEAYWTALALTMSNETEDGVQMAFMGTRAGLMRNALYVGTEKLSNKNFLTSYDKESIFTMDHFPLWYRRAAEHPPGSFIYSLSFEEEAGTYNDLCFKNSPETLFLYHTGLWLQIGKFLGEIDGSVTTQLANMGMLKKVKMFDYQAMCKAPHHHHSGARPLLSVIPACLTTPLPFWADINYIIFFFFDRFLLEFNIFSFWHTDSLADAHKHKKHDVLQPCDTEYPVFVYEPAIKEANGLIDCGACQKMFLAQQVMNSNLVLLVTDATCDCSIFPSFAFCVHNSSVKCDRMRSQKLRRRPDTCHAFHPEENAQDCGGAAAISASSTLLLFLLATEALLLR
uniref:Calcium voltage-gated channel auxiliary subunit alpha2delta 4 n=1 Tax=Naja naja TaxID=35670 RepID=A0A8C6YF60_NAJNA